MAGVGIGVAAAIDDAPQCVDGAQRLDGAWGADARSGISAAFASSALSFAAEASRGLEDELDRYAQTWAQAYDEACAARSTARMECLDARRRALASLTAALHDPSPDAIAGGLEAARGLPPVAGCASMEGQAAPVDPSMRGAVEDVRERIARAESMAALGDVNGALGEMREASIDADALVHAPLQVEAALALGQIEEQVGNFVEAEAQLRRAYFGALQAGDQEVVAQAATALVSVVGDGLGRFAEAQRWVRHAEAALDATGGERMPLWVAVARVHYRTGALDEAEAVYSKALERAETLGDPLQIAARCHELGLVFADRGAYPKARALHERGMTIRAEALGPGHPAIADSRVHLANLDQLAGRYDEALQSYELAEATYVATHGPEAAELSGLHYNVGRLRFMRGDLETALEDFDRAVVVMQAHRGADHPMVATVHNARSAALRRLGRLDEALGAAQRAEAIQIRAFGRDHAERAGTLVSLANIYDLQGRVDEALALHEESHRIFAETLGPEHPMALLALTNQALLFVKLEQPGRAVSLLGQVIEAQRRSIPGQVGLALSLRSLGHALNHDGRPEDAIEPLRESLQILEEGSIEGQARGENEMTLARSLWETGERAEAVRLADAAYERFIAENATDHLADADAWRKRHGLATRRSAAPAE